MLAVLEGHASSSLGVRAVRELAPLDYQVAKAALARSREALLLTRTGDAASFAGVTDPLPALVHARKAGRALEDDQVTSLRAFFEAVVRLVEWMKNRKAHSPALAALADDVPDFQELVERIDATVDERGRVRDHASPLLWRLRQTEAELSAQLDKLLRSYITRADVKAVLSDPDPMRRGGRAVLAVKAKSSGRVRGIVHDRSSSGETIFIEPHEAVLLGNKHSEAEADKQREVERILLELTRVILGAEPRIVRAAERVAELELAFIGAKWAKDADARPALLPGESGAAPGLLLRSARHPLLIEQVREKARRRRADRPAALGRLRRADHHGAEHGRDARAEDGGALRAAHALRSARAGRGGHDRAALRRHRRGHRRRAGDPAVALDVQLALEAHQGGARARDGEDARAARRARQRDGSGRRRRALRGDPRAVLEAPFADARQHAHREAEGVRLPPPARGERVRRVRREDSLPVLPPDPRLARRERRARDRAAPRRTRRGRRPRATARAPRPKK